MGYLSKEEFEFQMKEIQRKNISKERKRKLKEEKRKYAPKIKLPSTSKIILFVVFLLCIEILVFCEYVMIVLGDASAMYALIGIPVALIPTILGYYSKSKAENTVGGITYDMAMSQFGQDEDYDECEHDEATDVELVDMQG